jgi:hypothetical protein
LIDVVGPYAPYLTARVVTQIAEELLATDVLSADHRREMFAVLREYVPAAYEHPNGPVIGIGATMEELLASLPDEG